MLLEGILLIMLYHHYLVYPLHVVPQLLQVLDVAVADLADDEVALALALSGLAGLHDRPRPRTGARLLATAARPAGVVSPRERRYRDARRAPALPGVLLTQALRKTTKFKRDSINDPNFMGTLINRLALTALKQISYC